MDGLFNNVPMNTTNIVDNMKNNMMMNSNHNDGYYAINNNHLY